MQTTAPKHQSITKAPSRSAGLAQMQRAYRDVEALADLLAFAQAHYNLVSPAASCGALPEGCSIALSTVVLDPTPSRGDVYPVRGRDADEHEERREYRDDDKFGLSKTALDRIAAAAGISWDGELSRRTDDASNPYFCSYKVVGTYRHFDGRECQLQGEKAMDLREGSPQLQALRANVRRGGNAEGQIRELRLHILGHAETKARLRAIRALGIRTAYTKAGGRRALYGDAPRVAMLPQPPTPPPPVGAIGSEDEDDDESIGAARVGAPSAAAVAPPTSRAASPRPAERETPLPRSSSSGGFVIPGGREKGVPLEKASEGQLRYWVKRIEGELRDGRSRNADRDEELIAALQRELGFRAGTRLQDDAEKY